MLFLLFFGGMIHQINAIHNEQLIKFNSYLYSHHYENLDAFRLKDTYYYRNKEYKIENNRYLIDLSEEEVVILSKL